MNLDWNRYIISGLRKTCLHSLFKNWWYTNISCKCAKFCFTVFGNKPKRHLGKIPFYSQLYSFFLVTQHGQFYIFTLLIGGNSRSQSCLTFKNVWLTKCKIFTTVYVYIKDNFTWKIEKKALQYGADLRLSCQVKNCCKKSAGWGKWTYNGQFDTIFIDVKDFHNEEGLKYGGGTDESGFFLIIRNITKDDLNIPYSCTYGFLVSKKKMLWKKDAFFG